MGEGLFATTSPSPTYRAWQPRAALSHEGRGHNNADPACGCPANSPTEPNGGSRVVVGETNWAATHVEGAYAACGGAGGVRGLERRRPPPPSRPFSRAAPTVPP